MSDFSPLPANMKIFSLAFYLLALTDDLPFTASFKILTAR